MRLLFVLLGVGLPYVATGQDPAPPANGTTAAAPRVVDCTKLHPFKFQCNYIVVRDDTEQPATCNPDNSVPVDCTINLPGVVCEGGSTEFKYNLPDGCRYGSKTHHSTAMLLSIFFGLLGLDRFYLGYYTIGLIKLFSMGGLFILYFIDIVLIALQRLEPADGSGYIMHLFGPKAYPVRFDNQTVLVQDWSCADCR
ncbi:hypothetical protein PRIPAC_94550 [Pristionchus pacificus]|uniref:TM2 domain-containing protein n=1 Tax=Pristionchus pacificus TaxID=54126 RepID=A0A2A6BIF1_PRIPA|nr:hypothetical protein PRIPAC_94550 [Pristionchus pacificus]|eukprot:PDM65672.1 hypothetical protein PRIPAC_45586 [Pristionchus pacificus]